MNTHAINTTALGADDNSSPALNYYELILEDFRLDRRIRIDALKEAVYQADNLTALTSDDIAAAHRYMLHLLNTKTRDYVDIQDGIVNSVKLASDALTATRNNTPQGSLIS